MNSINFYQWLRWGEFKGVCCEHHFANVRCPYCSTENMTGAPARKWRFDFAWPDLKVAIEYEGVISPKARHTTIAGYTGDCTKYNTAALLGWQVYRFTAPMLADRKPGEKATVWRADNTVDLISKVLKGAR